MNMKRYTGWRFVASLGSWLFVATVVLTACSSNAGSAAQQEKARLDTEIATARTSYKVPDGMLQPIIAQENALLASTAGGSATAYQSATAGYTKLYNQVVSIEHMPAPQAHAQAQKDLQQFTTSFNEVQGQGLIEAGQFAPRLQQAQQQLGIASTTQQYFTVDGFIQEQTSAVKMIEPIASELNALSAAVNAQNQALGITSPTPQPLQCARGDVDTFFYPDPTVNVVPQQAQNQPSYSFQQWPAQDMAQFRAASTLQQYNTLAALIRAQRQQLATDAALAAPRQAATLVQGFQSDVQTYMQGGGTDKSFQQQASKDAQSLRAAETLADFSALIATVQKQRAAMAFPLLKVQTQQDLKTLQQLTDQAQSLQTIDPANGLPYSDGYEYANPYTGVGDARQRLDGAQTQDDYQVIDDEIRMFIANIQAMLFNLNDKTPVDQPHATDMTLLQHYGLTGTRVMMVSLREQEARMYDNGQFVKAFPVTTGNPDLPSPPGVHCIFVMMQNYDDISPFPKSSPYYYNPTHINYGMVYSDYGYIVHDAWWRSWFGKYSNLPHYDPISFNNGSHGCVNLPLDNMAWLYNWGSIGLPVILY